MILKRFIDNLDQHWTEVSKHVRDSLVFMDDVSAECLHWHGGLRRILDGGAISVENFSPFVHSQVYIAFPQICNMAEANKVNLKYLFKLEAMGERNVVDWCMENGLIAYCYICPICSKNMKLTERKGLSDGWQWRCRAKSKRNFHDVKRSVRKGSWFAESRMSLSMILQLTYLWYMKLTNEFITNELQLSMHTVIDWKMYCREVCIELCCRDSVVLGGPGVVVDLHEGKCRKSRCRDMKGKSIFCGIERGTSKCFLSVVDSHSREVLLKVLETYVLPESKIISDCWETYNCNPDEGFIQLSTNHSLSFQGCGTDLHMRRCLGSWMAIGKDTQQRKDHFDSYLAEYLWRKNHKEDAFLSFMKAVADIYRSRMDD